MKNLHHSTLCFASVLAFAVLCTGVAVAGAAPVKKIVSCGVGDVAVECAEPGGWRFATSVEASDGMDIVTVRLSSDVESPPPKFDVTFKTSGADVLHVWSPFDERCQLWPIEWGKWRYESELAFRAPVTVAFNERDCNKLTLACSEVLRKVSCQLAIDSVACALHGGFRFFSVPEAPMSGYEVKVRIDRRNVFWAMPSGRRRSGSLMLRGSSRLMSLHRRSIPCTPRGTPSGRTCMRRCWSEKRRLPRRSA